jgi:exodeoxyribonuclease V alpha subunit
MIQHLAEKQVFARIGIITTDLEHHAALLATRLYPDVARAAYAAAMVLQLRQRDGAIAIPWPHVTEPTVLDLLAENLPLVKSGVTAGMVRELFGDLSDVALHRVIDGNVLVHDNGRLYLRRFWRYELDVAEMVLARSVPVDETAAEAPSGVASTDSAASNSGKLVSFAGVTTAADGRTNAERASSAEDDLQQRAVEAGLTYRFAVITGGPGTGKTTSVLRLLVAMLEHDPALRIVLCAPTGKAAARMMESIQNNLAQLDPPEHIRAGIPAQASTIHRLIRWNPSLGRSVYHPGNPLPYDVVILDEASMVDVALMSRLARALRAETRLVLLGDKDQLSSVEAGSVFADIASQAAPNVVRLTRSWRFSDDSPIGQLARRINAGDGTVPTAMLQSGTPRELQQFLARITSEKHANVTAEADPVKALRQLSRTQILTALRVGPFGADAINAALDHHIGGGREWYAGRPVMATSNNYDLEIFNGDIGITRQVEGRLMVAFEGADSGSVRWIAPAQLKSVASAWALTVHKSQGSEYDEVIFVLPDRVSPVLTRELAYTALTRARRDFRVWGSGDVWQSMIAVQVPRYSGLADRLRQQH